jgi:hypothetical protein
MHKNAMKCNKTQSKWCINKHGASKIIDTFETYHGDTRRVRDSHLPYTLEHRVDPRKEASDLLADMLSSLDT